MHAAASTLPAAHLLVVDDDRTIRGLLTACLTSEGYSVATAEHGLAALAAVADRQPDLVLCDLQMPVLDGFGFIQHVRDAGLAIPIVVMSAALAVQTVATQYTAAGHLAKPFAVDDLVRLVERLTAQQRP
jgi:CheY-like chemotaxis protein